MSRPRRSRPPAAPAPAAGAPAAPPSAASRAAFAILAALVLLALARALLGFVPGMDAWSLNLHRFLAPGWAWLPWGLAACALIPPVARRVRPALDRSGDWAARHPRAAAALAGAAASLLAFAFPDQVRFTGDFLIRQGTVEVAVMPERVWPQAMPLDAWLHFHLPLALTRSSPLDANAVARLLGALEAALLGALAAEFARVQALRGAAAWTAAGIALGGTLGLMTGYAKAFTEMAVLTALLGVAGLHAIRHGRGLVAVALAVTLGLAVHRSAVGFLPAAAFALVLGVRHPGAASFRSWRVRLALALPLAALGAFLPRIVRLAREVDPVHFASAEVAARGGLLASALDPLRLADTLNVLALLAPLAATIPLALAGFGRDLPRGREALFLALLAAPFVLAIPLVHALGGLHRDVDDFAAAGVAVALLGSWLAAEALRGAPAWRWVALPLVLAALAPTLQWLAHQTDVERGLARVEAFVAGPPQRTAAERARSLDFLGGRWNQLGRDEASAEAYRRGAEIAPSPRMLHQWAIAEEVRGNFPAAVAAYRLTVERDSSSLAAWQGWARAAGLARDRAALRVALLGILRRNPADAEARRILAALEPVPGETKGPPRRAGP